MIEIKNLHKSFNDNKVLQGVDLNIDTGETLVIIGRSGCGKSVLIKHIVGLLYPDEGYVKVEGKVVDEMSMKELYDLRTKFGLKDKKCAFCKGVFTPKTRSAIYCSKNCVRYAHLERKENGKKIHEEV